MRWARIVGGLVAGALAGTLTHLSGQSDAIVWTVAITTLTAFWWISEALPIPATSLVPFMAFPLAGVLDHREAAAVLGDHVIILLMGAFMMSKGLEKSGAHERLALYMIGLVGGSGKRLVFGFMIAGALISMWVSNTATVLMLMPIALAILSRAKDRSLDAPVVLGVAYAASIGGLGTLIGTPPNVIFAGVYERATGAEYGFVEWMKTGVPAMLIATPLAALWLARNVKTRETVEIPHPGAWRAAEWRTLAVFSLAVLLWITRAEPFGGWSGQFGMDGAGDSTVALIAVVLMFLIPDGEGGALLNWKTAVDIPWGLLLLFAGGICIAAGFEKSGLSALIGNSLAAADALPVFVLMLVICLVVTFMSELTSNTAVATLVLPVFAAAAAGAGLPPEVLMVPAAMAASSGFMLPVSTAPNAIAYGTERVTVARMAREGFALNIMLALVISAVCYLALAR
jgi:sodium-dependent dicarboxylate transporter 2/3/5